MSNRQQEFAEELRSARPATRHVIGSILLDTWPNLPAIADFGIDSQKHYEALYHPIRNQEITPKELDAALGDGQKLTALTRAAPSNPHKDVEFQTSWDVILSRDGGGRTAKEAREAFNEVLHGKTEQGEAIEKGKDDKDWGIEQ
jgi:hypothetical protein